MSSRDKRNVRRKLEANCFGKRPGVLWDIGIIERNVLCGAVLQFDEFISGSIRRVVMDFTDYDWPDYRRGVIGTRSGTSLAAFAF